jgi:hypothetical protein
MMGNDGQWCAMSSDDFSDPLKEIDDLYKSAISIDLGHEMCMAFYVCRFSAYSSLFSQAFILALCAFFALIVFNP